MSKIVRAAVIAVLVAAPTLGATATASATALPSGIGWDQAPAPAAAAAAMTVASPVTPAQTDGIGWD
ncbi:hypothetical protein [Streptacidiphilus anmyonensis]|uniref:hypothetical protein n=1 Tax=Streptacidiphilus anmyonensis TaxID=405782 RepID=UPI00128B52EF|nr:hypothetical protein [Streptacidiphilus anmyonensis]